MRSADQVKAELALAGAELARLVAPDGKLTGSRMATHREWIGHGPDGAKWGIVLAGRKLGRWQNFGARGLAGTSFLSLIRDAFCGGDHLAAWSWAQNYLDGRPPSSATATMREAPPVVPLAQKRSTDGKGLWLHAEPFTWDGPVGLYLRGRGIDPERLGDAKLGALRLHKSCWNSEIQRALPAMVACVLDPLTREHIATHRTYLHQVGRDWIKAPLDAAKKLLGPGRGGIIPLTKGASDKGLGKAPAGDRILLAEGIENALSVAIYEPDRRALAYVSSANLAHLELPEAFADVLLVADRDGENHAVTTGREDAIGHWDAEGRAVSVWLPPAGYKDANDYLQGRSVQCLMTA